MPPEGSNSSAFLTPKIRHPVPSKSEPNFSKNSKYGQLKRMEITFTSKRFIHTLVFILACMSIFRLLRFVITSYSSPSSNWPSLSKSCNVSDSKCRAFSSQKREKTFYLKQKLVTQKEYRFLSNIISTRAPCNLLIFGWEPQYRHLEKINAAGITVVLEDNPERIGKMRSNNSTKIYKVNYDLPAKEAYKLLKHARDEITCRSNLGSLETSICKLALTELPDVVYRKKWDVIVVDGPRSDGPEAPGRMAAIYSASVIGRHGHTPTNVVVHDVDRMIERWFSWEFLCEENLVSSKGRFWNFRISNGHQTSTTRFCSQASLPRE